MRSARSSVLQIVGDLRPERVPHVEGVDDPALVRRHLREVHVEPELGERPRDVVEEPEPVGRADLDHRREVGRVVVDPIVTGVGTLGAGYWRRFSSTRRSSEIDPSTARRSMPRNSRHRRSVTSGSKTPFDLEQVGRDAVVGREHLRGAGSTSRRARARRRSTRAAPAIARRRRAPRRCRVASRRSGRP